jgi:hypothetical protein
MTGNPHVPPSPADAVLCTLKIPAGLYGAFDQVARARHRTVEWMVLEFMRAAVGRSLPVQYNNKKDDEPLIIAARRAFADWRRYPNPQWLKIRTVGGVLAKLREQAERTAGAGSGRAFAAAMNDLLERSGMIAIDKRTRSCLVNCFEARGAITKWLEKIPRKRRPPDSRQIWRRFQEAQRGKSSPDAANDEPDGLRPVETPAAPVHPVEVQPGPNHRVEVPVAPTLKQVANLTGGTFAAWRAEHCEFGEGRHGSVGEFYSNYVEWMRRTSEYAMPRNFFAAALAASEFGRVQQRGKMFYGIALKADWARFDEWLGERCVLGPLRLRGGSRDLWHDCKAWIEARGGNGPSESVFVLRLAGIEGLRRSRKLPDGLRGFRGIALKGDVAEQLREQSVPKRYDDDGTGLRGRMSYRYDDEFGPLAYVLLLEGLQAADLFTEACGLVRLSHTQRVMRKLALSARFESWCRSTVQQIFEQLSTGNDACQIAQGLMVPEGWPPVPERVVERIRGRLAAAPDHSALRRLHEEMLNGGGPVDDRASDRQTSTPAGTEIIQYPRRDAR